MSGLTQGSIYALIGLGFTIIYSVTQIINFAQGEFVMLGGMLAVWLHQFQGLPLAGQESGFEFPARQDLVAQSCDFEKVLLPHQHPAALPGEGAAALTSFPR